MAMKLFTRKKNDTATDAGRTPMSTPATSQMSTKVRKKPYDPAPVVPMPDDPLDAIMSMERYAILMREIEVLAQHADGSALLDEAINQLEARTALVPNGIVTIARSLSAQPGDDEEDVEVQPYLLNIETVTQAQYQKFVDAGCYDDLQLWPEDIWPHLIELQDQTGKPGPRFWREGRHDKNFSDHPVVGVSWYEANAYVQWIGQRLPTEAEWQMAACWHIKSSADILRRFPWGDAMDVSKCNIWLSGRYGTCPVHEYETGAAPNRVLQLIGNVWEWTSTEFNIADEEGNQVFGEMPMYTIRGAAFDAYFESQATAEFRTGQISLARAHNVGFRAAMNLSDARWLNE